MCKSWCLRLISNARHSFCPRGSRFGQFRPLRSCASTTYRLFRRRPCRQCASISRAALHWPQRQLALAVLQRNNRVSATHRPCSAADAGRPAAPLQRIRRRDRGCERPPPLLLFLNVCVYPERFVPHRYSIRSSQRHTSYYPPSRLEL